MKNSETPEAAPANKRSMRLFRMIGLVARTTYSHGSEHTHTERSHGAVQHQEARLHPGRGKLHPSC